MRCLAALALAAMISLPAAAWAAPPLQGTVTRVIDGDSLVFQGAPASKPLEVRLQGIDAPEGCQDGGPEARAALQAYVDGKPVTLVTQGKDRYGRTLALLKAGDVDVNLRMVAEGQAWSTRVKWNRGPYVSQERMAQALKRGLHAQPGAQMPGDFRQRHGPCTGAPGAAASAPVSGGAALPGRPVDTIAAARCDGRTRCTQMRSCEEARHFLQHCPGVQMDGDHDGIPCERQWCTS